MPSSNSSSYKPRPAVRVGEVSRQLQDMPFIKRKHLHHEEILRLTTSHFDLIDSIGIDLHQVQDSVRH